MLCFMKINIPSNFLKIGLCLTLWISYFHSHILESVTSASYSKTCVKQPLSKRSKICFQDQLLLNEGQKYCGMLRVEHSAILLTFISNQLSLRSLFCLSLSGRFTQVLLYMWWTSPMTSAGTQMRTVTTTVENQNHPKPPQNGPNEVFPRIRTSTTLVVLG